MCSLLNALFGDPPYSILRDNIFVDVFTLLTSAVPGVVRAGAAALPRACRQRKRPAWYLAGTRSERRSTNIQTTGHPIATSTQSTRTTDRPRRLGMGGNTFGGQPIFMAIWDLLKVFLGLGSYFNYLSGS